VQKIDFSQIQLVPNILVNEKAVVITDNLNIRNAPSLNGTIIDKYHFGKIVTIYAIKDYRNTINGEYNCWYKLSDTEEVWSNALFIKRFPFFINSAENIILDDRWNISTTIEINDIIEINSKYYFGIYLLPDRTNKLQTGIDKTILINDLHFNIIDNNYSNLYKSTYENMKELIDELHPIIIQEEYFVESIPFADGGGIYYMPGYKAEYNDIWGISKLEITNKEQNFFYGLRIGERKSYLEKIFGLPMEIKYSGYNNPIWVYRTSPHYHHSPYTLSFEIENEQILNIIWKQEL
jgi:hypothetical protein